MFQFAKFFGLGRKKRSNTSKKTAKRAYSAAKISPVLADWIASDMSADAEVLAHLTRLRARSRDIFRNNPYGVQFKRLLRNNVIGPRPMRLENECRLNDGNLNKKANDTVKEAWERWHSPEYCTAAGNLEYHAVERMVLSSVAQDGFAMVRLLRGFDNEFGFALQPLESDHLDTDYNDTMRNGNTVRGGIETDRFGRPVAYWLYSEHPGHYNSSTARYGKRERIDAKDIIFLYVSERIGQTIAAPWIASALINLRHLGAYQEAAVVEARAGAAKMGVYVRNPSDTFAAVDEDGDEDEDDGWEGKTEELEPGSIITAPDGYDFKTFDPNNPNSDIDVFCKAVLRGVAAGMGVASYNLSNDYSDVNFSSARMGNSYEQDEWRSLQRWWAVHFERAVFLPWFDMATLTGQLPFSATARARVCKPVFKGRGWPSPDPMKEAKADREKIEMGTDSRTRIVTARGGDIEQVMEELKAETEMAAEMGIDVSGSEPAPVPQPGEEEDDDDG